MGKRELSAENSPMKALSLIGALLLISGCVTVLEREGGDVPLEGGNAGILNFFGNNKPADATPAEVPIRPAWTAEDLAIPMVLAGLPDKMPDVFLIPNLPEVGQQGPQASGTAWAISIAVTAYRRKLGAGNYQCSPAFIYNQANNGKDQGIEILHGVQLVAHAGCADIRQMPYREFDYQSRPDAKSLTAAGAHAVRGYGRADFTDPTQVRAHLLQGSVVIATMRTTENFVALEDEVWDVPKGQETGRHTVAVVGFDNKRGVFIIENSAGPKWGKKGFAAIPYVWFVRMVGQAYVVW